MQRRGSSDNGPSVARLTIQTPDWQDSGIGIVIAQRPLTLLVPSHLIELVEQGQSPDIQINGIAYENPKILPTPALQRDYLSVLQFPKRRQRNLSSAHLPKRNVPLAPGQPVSLQRLPSEASTSGTVVDVREQGDGSSIITDIEVSKGDSGSPLLVSGKLAAVCQGMIHSAGAGSAVAVPLSDGSLVELRKLRRRYRTNTFSTLIATLLVVILSLGTLAIYSANSFTLASIEIAEDGSLVTAFNAHRITLRSSWTRSFQAPIQASLAFSTDSSLSWIPSVEICGATRSRSVSASTVHPSKPTMVSSPSLSTRRISIWTERTSCSSCSFTVTSTPASSSSSH